MLTKPICKIVVLIFCGILLCKSRVIAQNLHTIKGKITDSTTGQPVQLSTVAVVDVGDSSLYSYTVSDHKGEFSLYRLPTDKIYKLIVSAVGYESFKQIVQFDKVASLKTLQIQLKQVSHNLNEVTITAERAPVIVKNDTIEFIAEAFKTRPNAVVEELLKKLPGVQVYQDGTIYVNGKKVRRILINGKGFFGNDTRIASRNLNADLIDKIQITDDREEDPNNLLNDNFVEKVIDLKLKTKIKKSVFGKIHGAAGTNDRYDLGGILNIFRDTLQISVIGFSNNANQSSFSLGDLRNMGGFERSGISSFHVNENNQVTGINGISLGGEGQGIQTISSGGINVNNDYGSNLSVNIQDFFTHLHNNNNITSVRQQFLNDSTLNTRSYNNTYQEQFLNTLSGKLKWQPGKLSLFEYTPQLTMSSSNNNSSLQEATDVNQSQLNQVENNQTGKSNQLTYSHTLYFNQKFKKEGEALTINQQLSFGPGKDNSQSISKSTFYPSTNIDSSAEVRNQDTYNSAFDLTIAYRDPLNNYLTFILGETNSFSHRDLLVSTPRSSELYGIFLNPTSETDFNRNDLINRINEGLRIKLSKKTTLEATLTEQTQSLKNSAQYRYDQHYFDLLPSIKFRSGAYSFNYSTTINQPGTSDLQPIPNLTVPLYVFTGNPYLKPSYDQNIYTSYFKYYEPKQIVLNTYVNADFIRDDVISKVRVDSNGVQRISTINKSGTASVVFGSSFAKNFRKTNGFEVKANSTLYLGFQNNPIIVDDLSGSRQQYAITFIQRIDINWKDIIQFIPEYRVMNTINTYSNVNYARVNFVTHRLNTQLTINASKKLAFESNYTFLSNPDVPGGLQRTINLVNSDITYRLMKENQCELRLAVYDLFDQNINVSRTVNQNYILDTQTTVLKRYVSLGVIYNIRKINKR
jgi:hypothetical protein